MSHDRRELLQSAMARTSLALERFCGLFLAGLACFYGAAELQSWVFPYWPFDWRAKVVYISLLILAAFGTRFQFGNARGGSEAVRVVLRYFLAFTMMKYGCAKLFGLQFHSFLYWDDLLGRDFSAFDKAWVFFSHSRLYGVFLGLFECCAAALLFFRRTTLAGALMVFAILLNIVIVDIEYEIPVVWDASVFLVMSLFLIAPNVPMLIEIFWTRQGESPTTKRAFVIGSAFALLLTSFVVADAYKARYGKDRHSPLYGAWELDYGVSAPDQRLSAEAIGIRRLYFEADGYFHVLRQSGKAPVIWASFRVSGDALTTDSTDFQFQGTYRKDGNRLILAGTETTRRLTEVHLVRVHESR